MASTPTPPQCSAVPPKPSQSERYSENNNHNRHHRNQNDHHNRRQNNRDHRQNNPYLGTNKVAITKSSAGAASSGAANPSHSSPGSAFSWKSTLSSEFSGRRSTRFVSKTHSGRPRTGSNPHTPAGEEALRQILNYCNDAATLERMLIDFVPKLSRNSDDYTYLIRELGEAGHGWKSSQCFEFAMRREHRWHELGRLTSTMISTLGKMGNIELAVRIFEMGRKAGYGNTVFSFTAMVSAYGRCGLYQQAVSMFEHMKKLGLRPNLVTYNAVIDAGAKGGVEFNRVVKHFEEMLANSILPDRITYNSLLAVCSKSGLWEVARNLFNEMVEREVDQDIFTYNTLLDVLCKSGQMDFAMEIMAEMPTRKIFPNVVTYSTVIDGLAKVGRLEEALNLFSEMKFLSIDLDRISYNTLLSIYTRLGRFEEAINVCKEMESVGIERDAVTYNALLGGYGKQGKYDEVRRTFEQMKAENIRPNLLTYSTMIDVYCKGGLYREAMDVFKEFKQVGLKADVVLYSSLIDSLCKNGLVKSAVMLLDEMTEEGVRPNVVTYNTIIDAFGWSAALELGFDNSFQANEHRIGPSSSMIIAGPFQNQVDDKEDNRIIQMFGQLSAEKAGHLKKDTGDRKDMHCILWLFKQMHELEIKPNVVTFSAILNACSRFNSFEDASMLLEELRLFDNHVYGVAHGLLMGYRENVWIQALSLFDEVKHMDSSTASAFYNALTDMLWHYDQKQGAQLVVLEGKRRNVWGEGVWSDSCLDLHLMSCGAACAMVHLWLLNIRTVVFKGCELPNLLSILTGWGKHSKVVGDGTLRRAVEALLNGMGAPFHIAETNLGRFISPGYVVASWMKQWSTLNVLVLHDHRSYPEGARSGQVNNLQALCL